MVQAGEPTTDKRSLDELKLSIKRLNSKAGQLKMDLHDLAEGLPTDFEQLMELAGTTYEVYRKLDEMKKQLKLLEKGA
ncbi:MAG TPA: CCE_0567 family metalloprotein [Oculatellaceae cyanobacterium]